MFAYDNNKMPTDWEVLGDGTLSIQGDTDALNSGGLSGHSFTLNGKTVRQTIPVKVSEEGEKTAYTFSTRIKKGSVGSCYVKIYNDSGELYDDIVVPSGTEVHYAEYEYKAMLPKDSEYIVEFYGSPDSNATFTDNMLAVGEYKSQWTQANGEVMNTNVVIDANGVTVKTVDEEGKTTGDYTTITTKEFAGYSPVNGTPTRVFSLNKDITWAKKLEAKDEINMPPIKIVPVKSGDLQGWAFVPSTSEV
jgi:hypothetical protein